MTRDELKPLAKQYFVSNSGLDKIYGTEDRHFFYEEIHAQRHCKADILYHCFTPEDFAKKKKVAEPKAPIVDNQEVKKPETKKPDAKKVTPKKEG